MAEIDNKNALLVELTADITSAYVSNNSVTPNDLPMLLRVVFDALTGVDTSPEQPVEPQIPAVTIKKSITDDYLVCLEDGRRFKSMKRHLRTKYNLSPEDYRARWGLAKTYPMVAPAYSAARSNLAKQMGLGKGGRQATKPVLAAAKSGARAAPKARTAKA
jgi:predicted transcriptional regulator